MNINEVKYVITILLETWIINFHYNLFTKCIIIPILILFIDFQ